MVSANVTRRLYRSLLRSAQGFDRSPHLACLIHRTGFEDTGGDWMKAIRRELDGPDLSDSDDSDSDTPHEEHHKVFNGLLAKYVGGPLGTRQMQLPHQRDRDNATTLQSLVRQEFRVGASSYHLSPSQRHQVAFRALRELNKKASWAQDLQRRQRREQPRAIADVSVATITQCGMYLVAHPLLTGYFRHAVVCLLKHNDGKSEDSYGLVLNRTLWKDRHKRDEAWTLSQVAQSNNATNVMIHPMDFSNTPMRDVPVKEGGPVRTPVQMLHGSRDWSLDGQLLTCESSSEKDDESEDSDLGTRTDQAVYYGGNLEKANKALAEAELQLDDMRFYVGASSWAPGQLESEVEKGVWIVCKGPPDLVLTEMGLSTTDEEEQDLWLSFMSACGEEEAALAHLVFQNDNEDDRSWACDDDD